MSMYNNDAPYSRIKSAHFGIKWFHDCSPIPDLNPCDSKFLQLLLAGLKRLLACPKTKKEPIIPEILVKFMDKSGSVGNLKDARLSSMSLLAYAGFLRHAELSALKFGDILVYETHIQCFIQKSKTDREGAWVIIGATGKPTRPVKAFELCAWQELSLAQ